MDVYRDSLLFMKDVFVDLKDRGEDVPKLLRATEKQLLLDSNAAIDSRSSLSRRIREYWNKKRGVLIYQEV